MALTKAKTGTEVARSVEVHPTKGKRTLNANGLTPKEQRVVDRFLIHFNPTKALQEATNGHSGVGPEATKEARRILSRKRVRSYITAVSNNEALIADLQRAEIDKALQVVGLTPITEFASWTNNGITLKDSSDLPPDLALAVSSVEFDETETKYGTSKKVRVRMHDKNNALANLMKRHGLMKQPDGENINFQVNVQNIYE